MSEVVNDLLPLSYINQFAYCPRRFWYMYVQGEMKENAHVLRGVINHERAHTPGYETIPTGVTIHRRVYVYSHTLGITGYTDLLEEHGDDEAQLCAQALCLEEMTGKPIAAGAIFYFGSRRRVTVDFTVALRDQTRHYIQQMQWTLAHAQLPAHTDQPQRCNGCSLVDLCLPKETAQLWREGGRA